MNLEKLLPTPRILTNKVKDVKSSSISAHKRHVHLEVVDLSYGGTHDYWVLGDIAIPKDEIKYAKKALRAIEGCAIYSEHPHFLSTDLHPICKFHTTLEAEKKLPELWEWANLWGERIKDSGGALH